MFEQVVVLVLLDGALDVEQCFGVVFLDEIHPSIGVDEVGVVGFVFNGKSRHALGTVQVLATQGEVVGIVVENPRVEGGEFQGMLIALDGLDRVFHLAVSVAHARIDFGKHFHVGRVGQFKDFLVGLDGFVVLLHLLVASCDITAQVQVVGIIFQGFLRGFDGVGIVVVYHVQDDHVAPPVGIGGIHVKAVTQFLDSPLVVLLGIEILAVELMDFGLVRMLLDEDREQIVDALGRILHGHVVADVTHQHRQFGVHIKLFSGQSVVDLLLIARTVTCLIAVVGSGEVDEAVVGGNFLGAVKVV